MQVVYERCCGLDVHKRKIVACLLTLDGGKLQKDIRTFSTTTNALLALLDWLTGAGCTHVAMESTGVYWKLGLQHPGGTPGVAGGQRTTSEGSSRTYDRRQRRRLHRRVDAT